MNPFAPKTNFVCIHTMSLHLYRCMYLHSFGVVLVYFSPGVLIVLAYAIDRDTLRRLNWSYIKASFKYRSTNDFVREYPATRDAEETAERAVLIRPNSFEPESIKND